MLALRMSRTHICNLILMDAPPTGHGLADPFVVHLLAEIDNALTLDLLTR
jgi:hypothetical protein